MTKTFDILCVFVQFSELFTGTFFLEF